MAERGGFEPPVEVSPYDGLAMRFHLYSSVTTDPFLSLNSTTWGGWNSAVFTSRIDQSQVVRLQNVCRQTENPQSAV